MVNLLQMGIKDQDDDELKRFLDKDDLIGNNLTFDIVLIKNY